jgi:hypothetical protein
MFREGHGRMIGTYGLLFLVVHGLTIAWNEHLTKPSLFDQTVAAQSPTLVLASQQLHHVFSEDSGMLSSEMLGATITSAVLMTSLAPLTIAHQAIWAQVEALPHFLVPSVFLRIVAGKLMLSAESTRVVLAISTSFTEEARPSTVRSSGSF